MPFYYDFERPIESLEEDIDKLKAKLAGGDRPGDVREKLDRLESRLTEKKKEIYLNLSPWQRVQMARHPMRPTSVQILPHLFEDLIEFHGDRKFRNDLAVLTGVGRLSGKTVIASLQAKGKGTQENIRRNFGMAHPEGYRKALRMFELAERWGHPILVLVDTPGAYPGLEAEERGQAEAIASNLLEMSRLTVPIIGIILSEGGSGGALGVGVADRMYMLENAIYSVISPEGCSAILWKDAGRAAEAAGALRVTADDLLKLGIVDGIVPEPLGGAHRDIVACSQEIKRTVESALAELIRIPPDERRSRRQARFRKFGC